jgi:hypothetical protein
MEGFFIKNMSKDFELTLEQSLDILHNPAIGRKHDSTQTAAGVVAAAIINGEVETERYVQQVNQDNFLIFEDPRICVVEGVVLFIPAIACPEMDEYWKRMQEYQELRAAEIDKEKPKKQKRTRKEIKRSSGRKKGKV